jgi:hypothetical protein
MNEIQLIGDKELMRALTQLDYSTQHKVLKKVVNDTAQQTIVKPLRAASPVGNTGNLRKSMGTKAGKSFRNAVVFAGPRMGGSHKGYIANILEHGKNEKRVPKKAKALATPWGPRRSVAGVRARPFVRPTIERNIPNAERHMAVSIRKIIQREWNRAVKRGLI